MQLFFLNEINDLTSTHYPYYFLLMRSILENHRFPIFNPLIFGGRSLLGDPQNGIFYPFTYLYLLGNFSVVTIILLCAHAAILFCGTCLVFHKIFAVRKKMAIFIGALFIFYPKWVWHVMAGHLSLIESFAWFPLILYFVMKSTRDNYKSNFRDILLFSTSCIFSIFANYFFFYQILLCVLFYYLVTIIFQHKTIKIFEIGKFLMFSGAIIVVVTAIQIAPGILASLSLTRMTLGQMEVLPYWGWKYLAEGIFFPFLNLLKFDQEAFLYSGIIFYILAAWGIIKSKFFHRKILIALLAILFIFILNNKSPIFTSISRLIPGMFSLRVTTRFWFFIYFILLIFLYQCVYILIQNKRIRYLLLGLILIEYLSIDFLKLTSRNQFGEQKETRIYTYLRKNYSGKKVYSTMAFLSQYYTAKYGTELVAGENPWQDAKYIAKLKRAGGYCWFNEYAVIFPPWQAAERKSQPNAKLLADIKGEVVLSTYSLTDKRFQYVTEIDKIKVYENLCSKRKSTC